MIVYRGVIERSRLSLLLDATLRTFGPQPFVWLRAEQKDRQHLGNGLKFLESRPGVSSVHVVDGRITRFRKAISKLRELHAHEDEWTFAIGFSALPYARRLKTRRLIWCVNGIPEERLLYRNGLKPRVSVWLLWKLIGRGRVPDLTVTVSDQMSQLICSRTGAHRTLAAPTCVDSVTFAPSPDTERAYMTYLGSGAPWQNLGWLSATWREVHAMMPEVKFRVISRDKRASVLGTGIDPAAMDITSADSPEAVAAMLDEALLGFVVRSEDIVNRVSFPTKIGEYLAAGVPPVTTDMAWAPADLLRSEGVGVLLKAGTSPKEAALSIKEAVSEMRSDGNTISERCIAAAKHLDRTRWSIQLSDVLSEITGHPVVDGAKVASFDGGRVVRR
ncbi:MAG: glycosyltransferase [Dehalococcoidia bacterium]